MVISIRKDIGEIAPSSYFASDCTVFSFLSVAITDLLRDRKDFLRSMSMGPMGLLKSEYAQSE